MSFQFNPFTGKLDIVGGGSSAPTAPTVYSGVTVLPTYVDHGDGSATFGNLSANLYPSTDYTGIPALYAITGNTFTMVDSNVTPSAVNYIVANWNGGSPILENISNVLLINESDVVPVYTIYRTGNILHFLDWDRLGLGLADKLNHRLVKTERFTREPGGLTLSEVATRLIAVTNGVVWFGANSVILSSSLSGTNYCFMYYHSGGNWTSAAITQYDNTDYDNGTNKVAVGAGKYVVNWVYRGVEVQNHTYVLLGRGTYNLAQAQASSVPPAPTIITGHAILVGRIIVKSGDPTATQIDSAFATTFSASPAAVHGDLTGRSDADQHPQSAITGLVPTEVEIDFGTKPVPNKSFTITDATITTLSKVDVFASAKTATGRVNTDDMEWDGLTLAAVPGTGNMIVYAVANPGPVVGKRKIHYRVG